MNSKTLAHRFVVEIPRGIEPATLYVSIEYATAVHLCPGCGRKVATPFAPGSWNLIFDGQAVSIRPSIWNRAHECGSHYWIDRDRFVPARDGTDGHDAERPLRNPPTTWLARLRHRLSRFLARHAHDSVSTRWLTLSADWLRAMSLEVASVVLLTSGLLELVIAYSVGRVALDGRSMGHPPGLIAIEGAAAVALGAAGVLTVLDRDRSVILKLLGALTTASFALATAMLSRPEGDSAADALLVAATLGAALMAVTLACRRPLDLRSGHAGP